ncbi:magnetosome protein MamC [Magnetospira sp. QH-2]|uniref:magnetosome protein MamC n=1 Tax=Magnetospira sp. (strain QH-2) TaxID=1288970 RepID=UPI0003E80E03|nr:magnetosome protein MamC [Magnetospira sp. QH-2]CCQ73708.1 Magnetosome protein MamC [Magnetospira sp. QH-2]
MAFQLAPFLAQSAPGVGVIGSIVGGSAALAQGLRAKSRGEATNKDVALHTVKEASGAGVATAISAYTVGVVGGGLTISLGTAFVAAVAGKYAWDRGMDYLESRVAEEEESA